MHKFSLTSAFVLSVFSFSLATDASAQGRYLSVSAQSSAIVECQYDMVINSCADAKLGRGNGEVVKIVRVVKKKRCVSVMVGGDGYCLKAK